MSVLHLIRPDLLNKQAYSTCNDQQKHRLHANELPWSALSTDIDLNYYPEKNAQNQLQKQLAIRYQVESDQMVLTRGSDDGIDLIMRLFLRPGLDACMQCPPTFSMYSFFVQLQQAQLIECPLDSLNDFELPMDKIHNSWQEQCKIIILCNPNNPTGNFITVDRIARLCEQYRNRSIIVVDEAYIEFTQKQSATCLIPQFDNLIILRTLSKAYGLANLRLGVILAQSPLIQIFYKIRTPYPLSSVVVDLALEALTHDEWFAVTIKKIIAGRTLLIKELKLFPFITKVYPSETNFVLVKAHDAIKLASFIHQKGITIRSFSANSSLHDHLRITVGDEQQIKLLLEALASFQYTL